MPACSTGQYWLSEMWSSFLTLLVALVTIEITRTRRDSFRRRLMVASQISTSRTSIVKERFPSQSRSIELFRPRPLADQAYLRGTSSHADGVLRSVIDHARLPDDAMRLTKARQAEREKAAPISQPFVLCQ